MTAMKDDRPVMSLGHMVIPRDSAGQDWLKRQDEQRRKAVEIAALEAKKYIGLSWPEEVYTGLAQRIVTALDQRL